MPDKRPHFFALSVGLAAAILWFLIWNNAPYLFHAKLYEAADPGANSLSVLRAEHFHELYGVYSRWMFHHPGPALFYSFALGEMMLYQAFHVVPTPFNAQIIVVMALVASFFAAGISMAARWVRGGVFVPLALLLAVLHFMAVDPRFCMLNTWPPFVLPAIFFAMLIAGASVGAGQGDDLPLLVLAGGFTVHSHVAQPLFVVPIALLAYAGLAWACHARRAADAPRVAAAPWRVFPWAHRFAALILTPFVLPIIVDLFFGSRSNLAHILNHMRTYQGERQPWLDSLYCFLRFSTYKPSHTKNQVSPGHVSWEQIGHYLAGHPQMMACWLCALLLPPVAFAVHRVRLRRRPAAGEAAAVAVVAEPAGRWRFLGWLAGMWLLSAGLTVVWNHIQDGDMMYYNSWFTYAIYYALALLAAGAISDLVENRAMRARRPAVWTTLAAALCLLAAAGVLVRHLGHFRTQEYNNDTYHNASRTVDDALAARPDAPPAKLLVFPHDAWGSAAGITIKLARAGRECVVPPDWSFMFGDEYAPADLFSRLMSAQGKPAYEIWHIVSRASAGPELAARSPLIDGYALQAGGREIDPAAPGAAVSFVGAQPNADSYALTGWADADPGAEYTWSIGKLGVINFSPKPVPANAAVEVEFGFLFPCLHPGKRDSQRLVVGFNGHDVGTLRMDGQGPHPLKVTIPAAWWNERASALLTLGFPDAISPLEAGESADFRQLAFATQAIAFRLVDAVAAPPAP